MKILGLAFTDRSIAAAEVSPRDGAVVRTAEASLPADLAPDNAEALGALLTEFLRANHFSASRVVVGLPARWLLSRGVELPQLAPALAGEALRMQAEREFSMELSELELDYAGETTGREANPVLLIAVLRRRLELVVESCRNAGLKPLAVTASALALSRAVAKRLPDGFFAALGSSSAELLCQRAGAASSLRHIGLVAGEAPGSVSLAALGNEIRRVVSLSPNRERLAGERSAEASASNSGELVLWDGVGVDGDAVSQLAERIAMPVRVVQELSSAKGSPEDLPLRFGPAVALALAGAQRDLLEVDFLHSRCAPPRTRRFGRKTFRYAALAAVLAIGGVFLFLELNGRERELAVRSAELQEAAPNFELAEKFVKNNKSLVEGWYDARPRPLDVLKRVTLAFPEEGRVWATSVTVTDGRKGTVSGKAKDQPSVLAVRELLGKDRSLTDVQLSDMREGAAGAGVVFAMTFNYVGQPETLVGENRQSEKPTNQKR